MPEPTLNLQFDDYLAEIGAFLGWGRGNRGSNTDRAWSDRKFLELKTIVQSGLRKFYFPPVPYEWSFLRRRLSITLPTGATLANLPRDFGGFVGPVAVSGDDGANAQFVRVYDDAQVGFAELARPDDTGIPSMVSERIDARVGPGGPNRSVLHVFPTTDQSYDLLVVYDALPEALIDSHPYTYGGTAHAEAVKESCLAAAELQLDNLANGPHEQMFQRLLASSIQQDRKHKAQYLGRNTDRSDDYRRTRSDDRNFGTVTFDGVQY